MKFYGILLLANLAAKSSISTNNMRNIKQYAVFFFLFLHIPTFFLNFAT